MSSNPSQAAVGSDFIAVFAPFSKAVYGLWQALKSLLARSVQLVDLILNAGNEFRRLAGFKKI